ncbi:hypothetical protein RYX36_019954, partial [Vicia faba]
SPGNKTSYKDAAIELGRELVSRNIDLVYGGGSIGLMGLVSQAVYDGGRHVIGVIPKTLMPRELTGETVGEVKAVADMHQRKAEMARNSDAFIALPDLSISIMRVDRPILQRLAAETKALYFPFGVCGNRFCLFSIVYSRKDGITKELL